MTDGTAPIKYVFLDVERFTDNRSVEAQAEIVSVLNGIVLSALDGLKVTPGSRILLPTGDGICIALLHVADDLDIHLRLALVILSHLHDYNAGQSSEQRRFRLRIGINQNIDNLVTDINARPNVAGAGVNVAQRIMTIADGNQIMVAATVYDNLRYRERYTTAFREYSATVKHDVRLAVYQYIGVSEGLDTQVPRAFSPDVIQATLRQYAQLAPRVALVWFVLRRILFPF